MGCAKPPSELQRRSPRASFAFSAITIGKTMSESSTTTPTAAPAPIKKNDGWIYFFVFIIVSSIGVAGFMIWFNLSIQLKPEQLEAARQLWKKNGPKSYNMVYTKRLNEEEKVDKFVVEVRDEKVTKVLLNGRALAKDAESDSDPRIYHSMDVLLRDVQRFMDIDQKPGAPKVYVTAIFEPDTGALRRYIRRVMGTRLRIEMHVTIEAIEK
jgi:hypothetical protein